MVRDVSLPLMKKCNIMKSGTLQLEDLKGLSEQDMKDSVAALNLKPVQFIKLFREVSKL